MVLAERNPDNVRNGKRSRGPSPNGHASEDSSIEEEADERIRVGRDYQAIAPDLIPLQDRKAELTVLQDRALLVWSPTVDIPDMDDYISLAKERYGYNGEQALGMLFWHKHDLERAILDLSNFTPFPDEWSVEDKVLFEQAFQFHGKSFHRIRQMLPDKSIASLVKYYYSWKKTRTRTSLMDRQARKLASHREDGSEGGSEVGSNTDSDSEEKKWTIHRGIRRRSGSPPRTTQVEEAGSMKKDGESSGKGSCSNCSVACSQTHSTPKGVMCSTCFNHWTRTGNVRPTMGPAKPRDRQFHVLLRHKRKPPRGMFVNHDDLIAMASGPAGLGEQMLRTMDREIVSLKRQVQSNKQAISAKRSRTSNGIDEYRPSDSTNRINARWTNDEMMLAVQGMRKYGKDFQAISEMIGTKTEAHLRNFFTNQRRRFNLDAVLKEFEAENGPIIENESKDDKMDVDIVEPSSPPMNSAPVSVQASLSNIKSIHKTAVSATK
ncbi:hypothetical protein FOCC_FOCC016359 [Frankliniella occidentalis]|nr:hypothetical protein FOCC_FOCC016359 [Frankliniella occidentalis]